jgi:hypothetical protein
MMRRVLLAIVLACAAVSVVLAQQRPVLYKVDPFWPQMPLPNNWGMQQVVDIYVDRDDHVWIINRADDARPDEIGAPRVACCVKGPEIIEFDPEGNVVNSWTGSAHPGWPGRLQTIGVDRQKNIYVSGTRPGDSIIKFSRDGKFLWDFGHRGPKVPAEQVKMNNQQTDIFPPGIGAFDFDEDAREVYITDGFLNKRVLVYDMDSGAFKRGWGWSRHAAQRDHERADAAVRLEWWTAAGSEGLRSGPALRAPVARQARLCVRARDESHPGVHDAGDIRQELPGAPRDSGARTAVRRHLEYDRATVRHRLQPGALTRSPAAPHPRRGRDEQHGLGTRSADRRAGQLVRRQRPLRRPAALDRRDQDRFEGERLHRRGRGRKAHPEVRTRARALERPLRAPGVQAAFFGIIVIPQLG